jgi:hypothetical protein
MQMGDCHIQDVGFFETREIILGGYVNEDIFKAYGA